MKPLFTLSFLLSFTTFSQTAKIVNSDTDKPIKEVFVYSKENPRGVLSDTKGEISLSEFGSEEMLFFQHVKFDRLYISKTEALSGPIKLSPKKNQLPTVYFDHPLRYNIEAEDEPGRIEKITKEIVKLENPATSADMLQNTGGVLVQKSQGGGGSPIIRGFEANKLLLVIDGVRMNNAIYRSGHLQNAITVDNGVLDHTEVIFGPSSSLYGSDALGGVIHFHTIDPEITNADSLYFTGNSNIRFNTNNKSMTGHFDFSTGKNKWALLSSFTASKFGDIISGQNRSFHNDANWGLHQEVVIQTNGNDSIVENQNPNIQANSGYSQFDFLEKFIYQSNDHLRYTFNLQFSTSSEINRYDKLTEYSGGNLRYAEWYYGPQTRFLGQFKVDFSKNPNNPKNKIYHAGVFSLAYQKIEEDRISRRFQSANREFQEEDVDVISLNLDFNRILTKNRIFFYGLEAQHNIVHSTAYTKNINSGLSSDDQTRYPQESNYLTSGVYVEFKKKFNNRANFTSGLRYSFIYANSQFTDTSFLSLPFNEVNLLTAAPSGNAGFVFRPDTLTKISVQATTGFRAPNIDDYGKVFEKSGNTVVPNNNLKPEYALGGELSVDRRFGKDFIHIGATTYATYLFNAMVQRDFTLNGQDSILYNGEMTKIQAIVNTDQAVVYGVSAHLRINFTRKFNFVYSYNFTKGLDLSANTPLEHIAPQFGKIAFNYSGKKLNSSIYSFYNFRKRIKDYTPGGDNIDLTPNQAGTPPWWTLNYRISYTFYDKLAVQFAAENILDMHYRQFASGITAPGRNFMISLKAEF